MKYAIIGDIHGAELGDLRKALRFENPDSLICLGDFDQTKTINQFRRLERKYQRDGKQVRKVPGNHDHSVLNNTPMHSGTLMMQEKDIYELHSELMKNSAAHRYIEELVNSENQRHKKNQIGIFLDGERFGRQYRTIIVHGAFTGSLSSFPDCPDEIKDMWFRLKTDEDYDKNFKAMARRGYKVMIRGHDHSARYAYQDPVEGIVIQKPDVEGYNLMYKLLKHRKHTINPGALFDGLFAIIDTQVSGEEAPILRYCRL
jgi:predicted phosphodiesterase